MLRRSTLLAFLAGAAAVAATGGSATTVLLASANHPAAADHSAAADHRQDTEHVDSPEATPTATPPSLPPCPTDVKNHGAYVSSVAHGDGTHGKPAGEPGDHGALVSAAAQSDCGKPTPGASESESPDPGEQGDDTGGGNSGKHGKSGEDHGKNHSHPTPAAPTGGPSAG